MHPSFVPYRKAAAHLKNQLDEAGIPPPVVGIICGSGLSGLSATMTQTTTVPYGSVPGFPDHCGVAGHKGEMVFGLLSNVPTVCFRGRFHSYEGHDMQTVVLKARVMRCLGVKVMFVTNAAGGLNPAFNVGDIVSMSDHYALPMLAGSKNPLVGPNDEEFGPRFPPVSNAYDEGLRKMVDEAAGNLDFRSFFQRSGTYCFVSGPNYESKSECASLRAVGGDCVGMSTAPEVVVAHHSGIKVVGLSLVTNKVVMPGDEGAPPANHEEVLEVANMRAKQMQSLVKETVRLMSSSGTLEKLPQLPAISLDVPRDTKATRGPPMLSVGMGCALIALSAAVLLLGLR